MKISPIKILRNENQELIAVDFGQGGRTEHEHGITRYKTLFGVDSDQEGLNKYSIHTCPEWLKYQKLDYKNEMYHILHCDRIGISTDSRRKHLPYWFVELFRFKYSEKCRLGINAAWDQDEFIIIAHEKYKDDIELLYNAFINRDILLGYTPIDLCYSETLKFSIKSKVENLPINTYFDVDDSGVVAYQNIDCLDFAENRIYDKALKDNEIIDTRKMQKLLKQVSEKNLIL